MTLWLTLSLLLALAVTVLVWPFVGRGIRERREEAQDLALFREQIAELGRERAAGAVSEAEAHETRQEIERRVLAQVGRTAKQRDRADAPEGFPVAAFLAFGWVAVGSVLLYGAVGRPELATVSPGPGSAGLPADIGLALPPRAAPDALASRPTTPARNDTAVASVEMMIARLAERLEREPDDIAGWRMLGWSYSRTGGFRAAADAYGRAVDLAPEDDELAALHGEALTLANGGLVDAAALAVFDKALRLNPTNARAGFYRGLALDQSGEKGAALEIWLGVLDGAPPDADWLPGLIARIRERAAELGVDVSGHPRLEMATEPESGPTQAEIAAAGGLSEADRQAMIDGMVGRLSARLAEQPNDPEGWARLIRSYTVLERRSEALRALADARTALAGNTRALAEVEAAAERLGLSE